MEGTGGSVYGGSNMSVLIQTETLPPRSSDVLDSLWIPDSSSLHGSTTSMVNFEEGCREKRTAGEMQICGGGGIEKRESNEDSDGCFQQPEKKRRLTADQVQFLERSFEVENKLEPERKIQLAKDLGLQPRQVAIWFQNRRARYKTKLLEKDYDSLKQSFDKLKADYEILLKEKEKLKNEVSLLNDELVVRGKGEAVTKTEITREEADPLDQEPDGPIPNKDASQKGPPSSTAAVSGKVSEDAASSAKSDVVDFDSPPGTDANTNSFPEPADSSTHAFDQDPSDDEDDDLRSLLPFPCFPPKIEDGYYLDPAVSSCGSASTMDDHAFRFWSY